MTSGPANFRSVVTVSFNTGHELPGLLDSLRGTGVSTVVVVEQAGEDLGDLRAPPGVELLVVRGPNLGYGAGLDRGLRELKRAGMVLLCNPDIRLKAGFDGAVDRLADDRRIGLVAPRLTGPAGEPRCSCREFYTWRTLAAVRVAVLGRRWAGLLRRHYYLDRDDGTAFDADWASGAAMLIRTEDYGHAARFDPRYFMYFEDVDFCVQMWHSSFRVVCDPNWVCVHDEKKASRRRGRHLFWHVTSLMKFLHKYRGFPNRCGT